MTTLSASAKNKMNAPPRYGAAQEDGKPLVLVAEDHEDTVFLLSYLLSVHGCNVTMAGDGEEAVRIVETMRPALVLMDISLPRLDGLSAVRRIRQIRALDAIPIVFLSGHAEASFRATALAHGGNDYLVKPFGLVELEHILERYIGKRITGRAE